MRELLGMLRAPNPLSVRKGACEAVLGLTGTREGLSMLAQCEGVPSLSRLIGDGSAAVGELGVKCLINLSADAEYCPLVCVQGGVVAGCMDCLRDADCPYRHTCLMLLCNVASREEGCARIMQAPLQQGMASSAGAVVASAASPGAGGGAGATPAPAPCQGLHLRRLIQLFLQPVAAKAAAPCATTAAVDTFEYAGSVLASVSQRQDARALLLEPDRRILPILFPQLAAPSAVRRRGVAGTLRNCCFETSPEALEYMLSPNVDLATALLTPLAGPALYAPDETQGMHASLAGARASKTREVDPSVRLCLVEALRLLTGTRTGRDHLRKCRAYYVLRAFHWWLEGLDESSASPEDALAGGGGGGGGILVTSSPLPAEGKEEEKRLCPDDEATVEAIEAIVQQLFREDEVPPAVAGAGTGPAKSGAKQSALGGNLVEPAGGASSGSGISSSGSGSGSGSCARVDETGVESAARRIDELRLAESRAKAAREVQAAVNASATKHLRYATVPLEVAKERARKVANGEVHAGKEGDL